MGFFEFGQGHRGPMMPYCPGAHELSVRPCHRSGCFFSLLFREKKQ
ncbi:unnamed protein product, partial [Staurois parvus]